MRAGKWFCNDEQSWDGILTFDIGRVAARFKTDDIVGRGWLRLFLSLRRGPSWWPVPWPLGLARAPVVEEEEGQEEEEERQQQWASIGDSGEWLRPPGSALTHGGTVVLTGKPPPREQPHLPHSQRWEGREGL